MKTSISDEKMYRDFCKEASEDKSIFKTFKRDPRYTSILEHTSKDQGEALLQWCLNNKNFSQKKLSAAKLNDNQGWPVKEFYQDEIGEISPSSLRYLKCAIELENMFGDLSDKNIVEIGVGYGGLCGILKNIFNVKSYTLIDLPEPIELTKKYLNDSSNIYISDMDLLSEKSYDLVISNYAFTECIKEVQDLYIEKILQKSLNGYITYNNISHLFNVSSYDKKHLKELLSMKEKDEYPLTSNDNCILYWKND